MTTKTLLAAAAIGLAAVLSGPVDALAHGNKLKGGHIIVRDCKPYNGPFGYYGNPWCDGGYKYAEDYPPGSGRAYDLLDLPQVRRLNPWWD
jgi:hypothetical protein